MAIGVQTGLLDRDPVLREIVCRLVLAYEPEFVYLFGSKARGDSGPDSDYDLLVIVPDNASPDRRRRRLAYRALRSTGTAAGCPRMHEVLLRRPATLEGFVTWNDLERRAAAPCHLTLHV
jgi:predicted nucleotidyltransferase